MAKPLQEVLDRLKKVEDGMQTIELGVYGDSKNDIKGLIHTVKLLENAITKIQDRHKKFLYFTGGAMAVIEIILQIVKWVYSH
jgi:hypothetical protein